MSGAADHVGQRRIRADPAVGIQPDGVGPVCLGRVGIRDGGMSRSTAELFTLGKMLKLFWVLIVGIDSF